MSAQAEVGAQPAVEVVDERTGADDVRGQVVHGLLAVLEVVAELLAQRRLFLPTARLALVHSLQVEQFADDGHGDLELGGAVGQVMVELSGESQELVAVVFQQGADGTEAMRAERLASLAFGADDIEERAAVAVGEPETAQTAECSQRASKATSSAKATAWASS